MSEERDLRLVKALSAEYKPEGRDLPIFQLEERVTKIET
jgi:hypothetical protein